MLSLGRVGNIRFIDHNPTIFDITARHVGFSFHVSVLMLTFLNLLIGYTPWQ
jgi:hypothetical protein